MIGFDELLAVEVARAGIKHTSQDQRDCNPLVHPTADQPQPRVTQSAANPGRGTDPSFVTAESKIQCAEFWKEFG